MNDWFRSWHGAPTDQKWRTIAKRAGVAPSLVVTVAWALMDRASQADDRGSVAGLDAEILSDFLECSPDEIERVVIAMRENGFVGLNGVLDWLWSRRYLRPSGGEWAKLRTSIFWRDDFRCRYCGRRGVRLECDHIVPVSRGGTHEPINLATACFASNRAKDTRTPQEWVPA